VFGENDLKDLLFGGSSGVVKTGGEFTSRNHCPKQAGPVKLYTTNLKKGTKYIDCYIE